MYGTPAKLKAPSGAVQHALTRQPLNSAPTPSCCTMLACTAKEMAFSISPSCSMTRHSESFSAPQGLLPHLLCTGCLSFGDHGQPTMVTTFRT